MKTILVDAIYCFVLEDTKIFTPMYNLLQEFPNRKILLTGASGSRYIEFKLDKMPYEVFTLSQNPPKTDPTYYSKFLKQYNLKTDEVVYFEHNLDAVKSARSIGINTYHYDPIKKDLESLKLFLCDNLNE